LTPEYAREEVGSQIPVKEGQDWTYLTSPRILRPVRTFSGGELLALVLPRVTNRVRVNSFRLLGGVIWELYRRIRIAELLKQLEKKKIYVEEVDHLPSCMHPPPAKSSKSAWLDMNGSSWRKGLR
jgi:hypothetical protein